ncbi:hypothetical protein Pfo_003367 [Paulownia fortunei]|nr:hypothetical protein Pfo_003367 [Paulownia fortunei]
MDPTHLDESATIFVAGHRGLVGSAVVRKLHSLGYKNLLLRIHSELDLTSQSSVDYFFAAHKPQYVILAAAKPLHEFLHVDDLADAVVFLMENYSGLEHVNVGSGKEVSIKELAEVVGYEGEIVWDSTKPDGTPRKLMDSSKLEGLGWKPKISLEEGLKDTYQWYLENVAAQ